MISTDVTNNMKRLGVNIPHIFFPKEDSDMEKWAVIACDQYTSEIEYWEDVENLVGDHPSTLRLVYPEAYLEKENEESRTSRIKSINGSMGSYLKGDILQELSGFILVERTLSTGLKRHGLVLAVDLEHYDFNAASSSLIRATEGTIIDRLPPRIKVRENASLEASHIMLLIDDANKTVIEPLFMNKKAFTEIYDFDLMKDGGRIQGWKLAEEAIISDIVFALSQLVDRNVFESKYGLTDKEDVLLFAVGDGNHSLATAKVIWNEKKKSLSPEEQKSHPSRYALVEVVNLHDEGLQFEPINRVLFHVDSDNLLDSIRSYYGKQGCNVTVLPDSVDLANDKFNHVIRYVSSTNKGYISVNNPNYNLAVGTLQNFLDDYLKNNPQTSIDYVHGEESTATLGMKPGNMGFFLDKLDKNDLFKTVILDGALPRKTFSMGHASEKRYYLELRKIR